MLQGVCILDVPCLKNYNLILFFRLERTASRPALSKSSTSTRFLSPEPTTAV